MAAAPRKEPSPLLQAGRPRNRARMPLRKDVPHRHRTRSLRFAGGVGICLGQSGIILSGIGRARRHIDQCRHIRMHAGFRDDHAGKGMADQNRRAILARQHALGRSDRFRQRGQRILHGSGVETRRLQSRDHFGPARSIGEQSGTSTTLRAFVGVVVAAMPRVESSEAAAPASRAVEKARRLIMMSTPSVERLRYHWKYDLVGLIVTSSQAEQSCSSVSASSVSTSCERTMASPRTKCSWLSSMLSWS